MNWEKSRNLRAVPQPQPHISWRNRRLKKVQAESIAFEREEEIKFFVMRPFKMIPSHVFWSCKLILFHYKIVLDSEMNNSN